jgi:hypothetical protein
VPIAIPPSKLLNVELDNFGDSISSMSGLVEDYNSVSEATINNKIIKKDDFVIIFYKIQHSVILTF